MADWQPIAKAAEVLVNKITKARVAGLDLILLKTGDEVFAYEDRCPHEGHPLSLGDLEADVLICAKHMWEFEIKTGRHVSRIDRPHCNLKARRLRVRGGVIEVNVAGAGGGREAGHEEKG
jgi:toluene monooxygenase system ferredoxin subunit